MVVAQLTKQAAMPALRHAARSQAKVLTAGFSVRDRTPVPRAALGCLESNPSDCLKAEKKSDPTP